MVALMPAVVLLAACGLAPGGATPTPIPTATAVPTPPTMTPRRGFDLSDPARPILVRVGERFTLTLREYPSLGFHFAARRTPDPAVARLVDNESFGEAPGLAGSPTIQVWTYEATGPGATTITWQQARPNTTPNPNATGFEQPFTFTVRVQP